jgi:malonyl-CoA O-methyltransferase
MMTDTARRIAENFDAAAQNYDSAASVQAQIATRLINWAAETAPAPENLLDLGCGTGFAAEAAAKQWPRAQITALDAAPSMLRMARRKLPRLAVIGGDASNGPQNAAFDIVISSMMLHWLPEPCAALARWRGALKPGGRLYAALLVEGSFAEWRALCRAENVEDGLWLLPRAEIFQDIPGLRRQLLFPLAVQYPSARAFLGRLKATGAATPRANYRPLNIASMRRILAQATGPFSASFRVLLLELGENA